MGVCMHIDTVTCPNCRSVRSNPWWVDTTVYGTGTNTYALGYNAGFAAGKLVADDQLATTHGLGYAQGILDERKLHQAPTPEPEPIYCTGSFFLIAGDVEGITWMLSCDSCERRFDCPDRTCATDNQAIKALLDKPHEPFFRD